MSLSLNTHVALAKQAYEELVGLVPMESIARFEFGAGPKRERVEALLKTLTGHLHTTETALRGQISESADAPIVTMPNAHRAFCRDVLEPFGDTLQMAYWECIGLGGMARVAEDTELVEGETFLLNAFSWGLEGWSDAMDDEERDEWLCHGFKVEEALEMVATPWFRPDDWKENVELLRELGEEFTVALPELGKSVQMVRESGNRVVHPTKHDVIAHPKVRREEALDCIRSSRFIVEILYSSKVSQ